MQWSSATLTRVDVVGTPMNVDLKSATFEKTQKPASGQLVLFAKIYDVGPCGRTKLAGRLVAPMRIADITKRVRIQGMVSRFAAGIGFRSC